MTSEQVFLRPLEAGDADFQSRMGWEASIGGIARSMSFRAAQALGRLPSHSYEDWGRPYDGGLVVSTEAGEDIGAAWYRRYPDMYRVLGERQSHTPELTLAVEAGSRGRGIGSLLLEGLMEHAQEHDIARLRLSVRLENTAARRLYVSHGFAARKLPHRLTAGGYETWALRMAKQLNR